jgi:hypothetical protein
MSLTDVCARLVTQATVGRAASALLPVRRTGGCLRIFKGRPRFTGTVLGWLQERAPDTPAVTTALPVTGRRRVFEDFDAGAEGRCETLRERVQCIFTNRATKQLCLYGTGSWNGVDSRLRLAVDSPPRIRGSRNTFEWFWHMWARYRAVSRGSLGHSQEAVQHARQQNARLGVPYVLGTCQYEACIENTRINTKIAFWSESCFGAQILRVRQRTLHRQHAYNIQSYTLGKEAGSKEHSEGGRKTTVTDRVIAPTKKAAGSCSLIIH